ncbi:MAG: alpha-L-fucosidase [Candidatus Pacebacteria bacterium]|nr:alpha-L-fucosidase [Candidatus Paceibacterota bacterium]
MSAQRADIIEHVETPELPVELYDDWLWERLDWFQDLRFGLFMHWGPYCQWGCIESWPLVEDAPWARPDSLKAWTDRDRDLNRFRRDYWKLNETFNPIQFDPQPWAEAAWKAGMRYVAFTTKHHDGFCMFDTATTEYRVTHPSCPFSQHKRSNITRDIFDTFRDKGFAISCYFSKSDWHSPWFWHPDFPTPDRHVNYDTREHPEWWRKFVSFVHTQVRELMTDYGPIDALWLDGGQVRPPRMDIDMATMAAMARRRQPGLIMVDRTVGGLYENILTPEQKVPDAPLGHPWESCMTLGNGWAYKPGDEYKPSRQVIHTLVDIVAKNGNLLLNIGPSPEGTFAPEAMDRLADIGRWMTVNGEAVHGTRAIPPYSEGPVRFTTKDGHVYAIVLPQNGQNKPPETIQLHSLKPAAGSTVELLGHPQTLEWSADRDVATVTLPRENLPCQHAWVMKFQAALS